MDIKEKTLVSKPSPKEVYDKIIKDGRFEFIQEIEEDKKYVYINSRMYGLRILLGDYHLDRTLEEIIDNCAERALSLIQIPFEELRG